MSSHLPLLIDADAHVVEPADVFTSRLPSSYGDQIPHVRYREDIEQDFWFVGDVPVQTALGSVILRDENTGEPVLDPNYGKGFGYYAGRLSLLHPSSYDPNERVKVMDSYGIQAQTTYPWLGLTGPDVYRKIPGATLEFQLDVVRAYNDWILSWAIQQPGRFIPLAPIPYWDVDAAVAEIERCAEMGIKGLVMSGKPQNHGCPYLGDPAWDRMWAAAQAASLSINFHSGGTGDFVGSEKAVYRNTVGLAAGLVGMCTMEFFNNANSAVDLLSCGVLQRFPELRFGIIESGSGWVPFALESLDTHYLKYRPWETRPYFKQSELPSDLFRRQMFVCTWFEDLNPDVPIDNLMFETDYPHPTSLLGDAIGEAIGHFDGLSAVDREKVLSGNAMRCYGLEPADVGLVP